MIYDVDLTMTLPWSVTVTSAVNAMAHAVEALYSADRTTSRMRWPSTRSSRWPPVCVRYPVRPIRCRRADELLYGAWLGGTCLGTVGMGLHHKLCHTLGGSFDLPHAATHTVVLPYAMDYNEPAAPAAMGRIAEAMQNDHAPTAVQSLVRELGGPTSLGEIGFVEADIGRAAELAVARAYPNPREVTRSGITALLHHALIGTVVTRRY